ncbi:MAG: phosphoribosyltransferase [Lachnospiraceae bacterium]|nr:phosphoribosyltransferase [Lachnospiraceae bacterium]
MVFSNPLWNDTGEIIVYSNYHKYWLDKERKIKNPLFDIFSGRILDLKEGKQSAIQYFYNLLDPEICSDVTTTGNSLYACREILLEKGAQKVEMFALGKSI